MNGDNRPVALNNEAQYAQTGAGRTKQLAVVAMLIAIGAVLRMVAPPIFGITPNFVIAMYCLSIVLVRPKFGEALAIGIIGGALSMVTSKSPIPYINLASEPAGALACAMIVATLSDVTIGRYSLKPLVATVIGTLVSGSLYVLINKFALNLPAAAAQGALVGVVLPVTLFNAVIAQAVYLPAKKFLRL
ncbi:conserved hypothetical protein [Heliomicrobium modesticaldum Ice1]|uniref:Tryptophan transporter n=1 Tax=Heliobacterium modesticaldum (strain ATCC 51547 / Ice1) TaxID=498761 RepID=B0TB52_HELMI|nr:tryptophan transporter [Heliomicrobium modesticaldum]ABZ83779.1 conserved hypothetical protein [Heliomicrobium modesticaldum Ice1]